MDINWEQFGSLLAIILAIILFFGVILTIIYFGLSDEQRYGIDERGNAKTPKYMQEKARLEELQRSIDCSNDFWPY